MTGEGTVADRPNIAYRKAARAQRTDRPSITYHMARDNTEQCLERQ